MNYNYYVYRIYRVSNTESNHLMVRIIIFQLFVPTHINYTYVRKKERKNSDPTTNEIMLNVE